MSELPVNLDQLIDHVIGEPASDASKADALEHLATAVTVADSVGELADNLVGHFVDQARQRGASWAEIGAELGVTRQAVQKRFVTQALSEVGDLTDKRGHYLNRFTPRARQVLDVARNEARSRSEHVGTEHLLLGIASDPASLGTKALADRGAGPDRIRAAVEGRIGLGTSDPRPQRPKFTKQAKRVLATALREALRLGHNYIGTEHEVLALLAVGEGTAYEVLTKLGVTYDHLRAAVASLLADVVATNQTAERAPR